MRVLSQENRLYNTEPYFGAHNSVLIANTDIYASSTTRIVRDRVAESDTKELYGLARSIHFPRTVQTPLN